MNSTISDRIIKYLELIDENIKIMDNYINITENMNTVMEDNVIRNIFKSSIDILRTLYNIINKKEEFVSYHSGLLCEISFLLKKVYNKDMNHIGTTEFINLLKYLINLIQTIKKIVMPIEEIISIYPELSSLSKFHNINFYKLFILSYKVNQDFHDDEHVFVNEEKDNYYLLKKYNNDLINRLIKLENNNFLNIRRKGSFLKIEFNLYRFHPTLLNLGEIQTMIYKQTTSIFKLKSNLNKLKEKINYIALVMSNLRCF